MAFVGTFDRLLAKRWPNMHDPVCGEDCLARRLWPWCPKSGYRRGNGIPLKRENVCFYTAQYPVRCAAQVYLHFTPWQACSLRHQLDFSGNNSAMQQRLREEYSLIMSLTGYSKVLFIQMREFRLSGDNGAALLKLDQSGSLHYPQVTDMSPIVALHLSTVTITIAYIIPMWLICYLLTYGDMIFSTNI